MDFYFGVMNMIFFGFCKSINCQNICGNEGDLIICCSSYHKENGECVACPLGSFGVNCSKSCPNGFFGKLCAEVCNCTESEICDVADGCMDFLAEEISTPPFKEDYLTTRNRQTTLETTLQSTAQTTKQTTDLQDTEAKTNSSATVPLYIYLVSVGCTSLIFFICLMIVYRKTTILTRNVGGQESVGTGYELTCARQEQLPQSEDRDAEEVMSVHDYMDMIDVNSTYLEPCNLTDAKSLC